MKMWVTGTTGFIGSHVAMRLRERGGGVICIDNNSDYYDVPLKQARVARFAKHPRYTHLHADLAIALRWKLCSPCTSPNA